MVTIAISNAFWTVFPRPPFIHCKLALEIRKLRQGVNITLTIYTLKPTHRLDRQMAEMRGRNCRVVMMGEVVLVSQSQSVSQSVFGIGVQLN